MKSQLQLFKQELKVIFRDPDRLACHQRAGDVLSRMASERSTLHDIVSANLAMPGALARGRDNPVISMKVAETPDFSLIAHLWIPLDDRRSGLSHQSVHHHGNLLLTSVSAFGGGYESVLFRPGFEVADGSGVTRMKVDKIYKNPTGHLEFIGARTPHVVFFPQEFTVTYALWSPEKVQPASCLKRVPLIQSYKKTLKAGLSKLGLLNSLGLNIVEFLDFYPNDGKLVQMKERVRYPMGTNENFIQNILYCLQQMGFDRHDELLMHEGGPWLDRFKKGSEIPSQMEKIHLGLDRAQFSMESLQRCFQQ